MADVNRPMSADEEEALRRSANRGTPWGSPVWQKRDRRSVGIESSLRPRGRPAKQKPEGANATKK